MSASDQPENGALILQRKEFQTLFAALAEAGYDILGPKVAGAAIAYDKIDHVDELPVGWVDVHEPGRYRIAKSRKKTLFGYTLGMQSWKKFLLPPEEQLWEARKDGVGFEAVPTKPTSTKRAFVGVRACELAALVVLDKVLTDGPFVNIAYQKRRKSSFIVAVNCGHAGGACFCASMDTGPRVVSGYDLALTEVCGAGQHYFLLEPGSKAGRKLAEELPVKPATPSELEAAEKEVGNALAEMGRTLDAGNLPRLLQNKFDDPRWEEIAKRCLTCGNCTMVCPTCFCTNVCDSTDLSGQKAARLRRWDSCFSMDYSYIHGGSIRYSAGARYRQWLMHKLVHWLEQFGMSGCVGCGRCITWCPVGIDITEEAQLLAGRV